MYGHGNFTPQFGQGPAPPPRPTINQQGPPPRQSQEGQPGQHYVNPPPPPHSLYPPPPPWQFHGSTQPNSFLNNQQNFQWTPNLHQLSPLVPPFATGSENVRLPPPPPSQGIQFTLQPPPPPPISSNYMPSMGLPPPPPPLQPPPPPPPPPLLPSSPPRYSSQPLSPTTSAAPHHSESGASSSKHSDQVTDSVDRALAPRVITDDASSRNALSNYRGEIDSDLPPPPPKPTDEKIVHKIEVLCQYIAKNGPNFENLTLEKEFGNPEFGFLFGGEKGSEAEAAHEYFVWMKRRYNLKSKLQGQQQDDSTVRPSGNDSSLQLDSLVEAGVAPSPSDSDMDMEDDITQPVEEQGINKTYASPSNGSDLISLDNDKPIVNPVENRCASNSNLEGSSTSTHKDSIQINASVDFNPTQHGNGASPFRLVEDYDSDESLENKDETHLEEVSPVTVQADDASFGGEVGPETEMDQGCDSLNSLKKSEKIARKPDLVSIETGKAKQIADNSRGNQESIDSGTSHEASNKKNAHIENERSSSLKVDEFGRLVKEGASESDSDDMRYTKRRSKRGRSRSRSPRDRRRSPRRRKEKRSQSRSWSPKKRSRSRSPLRRGGDRRDKRQLPDCFDFRRGKCYRGASCRYLHSGSDKIDRSRHYRSKLHDHKVSPRHDEVERQEISDTNLGDLNIQNVTPDRDGKSLTTLVAESEWAQEVTEALDIEKELVEQQPSIHLTENETDVDSRMLPGETSWIQQSDDKKTHQVDDSSCYPHSSEIISSQSLSYRELPPPPLPHIPQYNMMQSSSSVYHHQPPIPYQHSHFSAPVNTSWHSLPPPPHTPSAPPPYINNLTNPAAAQFGGFQPNLVRPYLAELPARSQGGEFQHRAYPSMHESVRQEDIRPTTLPVTNPMAPQFGGPTIQGISSSFTQGNIHQESMTFMAPPTSRMQSFFADQGKNSSEFASEFGSRISGHYNPYASTFNQTLSSKFSKNIFNQEQEVAFSGKYGPSLNKDQYDPLFDSIEASSKSVEGQKREHVDGSDSMLRLIGSNKQPNVEKNRRNEDSMENDEFGETADAEVGAVENGSPSDPNDEATTPAGDVEIDQVKSKDKSKKSKDSRSMKLFKGALADFVKEVLKPSWRQGNMSKEAFKTIVKKTVDKASGAMKGHQIPKSQAKINHYIDSSQRKLTKLVMGYVDKYVKS